MSGTTTPAGDRLPLIERGDELARLDALLESARSGAGATLLIEGPAGIGKTSLLTEARERGRLLGMTVLHGRGTPLESEYPMGVVRQCLEPAVRRDADREGLFAGAAQLAESVLLDIPSNGEAAPAGTLHGLYWLGSNLASRAPVLLAVDDAHWADEPSLRFLAYLARRLDSIPIALVMCMRPEEEQGSAGLIGDIRSNPSTWELQPAPLLVSGVQKLLETIETGPVDMDFAQACHDATGGNPFLLGELVRALRADGVPFTAAGIERVHEVTPPSVARSVRATLDRLGANARQMAEATAVLGEDVEVDLAAELANLPMHEAAAAAAQLADAGILDDATTLRFRHPILSTSVRANQFATERAAAHTRAAELLRARGAEPERIAVQLMQAPPAGDERVVADLRAAAGRALARGAPGSAVSLFRRALGEPPPPGPQRGALLLELGRSEYAVGQSEEATAHLEETYRCAVDAVTRGRALFELFQTNPGGLASRRALAPLVDRTILELEDQDRELALRLRAIKVVLMTASPAGAGSVVAEGSDVTGATPGEAVLLGHLWFVRMGADASAAEVGEIAERAARQAEALLEEGSTALVITGIVLGLVWTDRLDEAERVLDLAVAVARRRGSTLDFGIALTHRSGVHRRAGRLLEAEADARTALAAAGESAWSWAGRPSVTPLLTSLLDQGRVDEAAQELAAADAEGDILDAPPMTPLLLERMRLRAAQRDHRRALADWEEAVRRAERLRGVNPPWIGDLAVAAEVHHALRDADAARVLTDQALGLARRWGTPGALGQALHAAARFGAVDDPPWVLHESVDHLRRSPARLELARALVTLGGVLRRRGNRVDSRGPLREGYDLARDCGAVELADTARHELRASGIRVHREVLTGAESLTASERRIADMAAAGDTNAEIAQSLFLTVKTVEMHLTSAYRKLGVRSRRDLPAVLNAESE